MIGGLVRFLFLPFILINPFLKGATDDGMAVSVMLQLLKKLTASTAKPLDHSVIFLWNNAEEMGLIGAREFTQHPWFIHTKGFINLEGAGKVNHFYPFFS